MFECGKLKSETGRVKNSLNKRNSRVRVWRFDLSHKPKECKSIFVRLFQNCSISLSSWE